MYFYKRNENELSENPNEMMYSIFSGLPGEPGIEGPPGLPGYQGNSNKTSKNKTDFESRHLSFDRTSRRQG